MSILGIENIFLAALTIVIVILFLFCLVLVRLERHAKLVPMEAAKTESTEAHKEVIEGHLVQASQSPDIIPAEVPEIVSIEPPKSLEVAPVETERQAGPPGCPHYLGYLKGSLRDGFVPDECLSCPKMLQCLEK